jgi:hypothetical protein
MPATRRAVAVIPGQIIGLEPGGPAGTFVDYPTPTGSAFPAGTTTTWTVDNTQDVTLSPTGAVPTGTVISALLAATPPSGLTSCNITATSSDGSFTLTVNVPYEVVPPPPATGIGITQLS